MPRKGRKRVVGKCADNRRIYEREQWMQSIEQCVRTGDWHLLSVEFAEYENCESGSLDSSEGAV